MLMKKNRNKASENRISVRLPDTFTIEYKIVPQKDFDKIIPFYVDRRTADRSKSKRYDADMLSLDLSSLANEAGSSPLLTKILHALDNKLYYMDKKIDVILQNQGVRLDRFSPRDQHQKTYKTGTCTNISGSGLCMLIPEKIKEDSILELNIEPIIQPPLRIAVLGKVVRVVLTKKKEKKSYKISTIFEVINEEDREELIKYIFKRRRGLTSSEK